MSVNHRHESVFGLYLYCACDRTTEHCAVTLKFA
jgi:hypothetical protein